MKKMLTVFQRRIILFCVMFCAMQICPAKTFAYDEDTHFLMTYVLLRSAGFNDNDAMLVAVVDQGMDDSQETVANGNLGPVSGVYPNVDEEWIWHALDFEGKMTATGILSRKEQLFSLVFQQSNYRNKLILLGIFFHYQQDTWAHRHHWGFGPFAKWDDNHLIYDAFTTYNTPTGHAKDGHMPDRPPFDPVCALMCLEDGIMYAKKFLLQTGAVVNPFFATYQPMSGKLDDEWKDERQGKYFNQIKLPEETNTPAGLANNYLSRLIHAQINAYSFSKTNLPLTGFQTPDKPDFDSVRSSLQTVCNSFSAQLGSILIPSQQEKTAMKFNTMTTAGLLALSNNMVATKFNIDSFLRPGDILFKYMGTDNKTGLPLAGVVFEKLITAGQIAYKQGSGAWNDLVDSENAGLHKALAKGNPNAVHMAIYLGNGMVAEAYGTTLDDASVNKWGLFAAHNYQSWYVFRPKDTVFARLVTEVAANWSNGRMKYLIPAEAAITNSWFGPAAKEKALVYANAFSTIGGPPSVSKMFCSQFIIAASQSAAARLYLNNANAIITTDQLEQLQKWLKLDSFSSPVTVFGEWESSGAFEMFGPIYTQEDPM